jgi:hypothetical protein
MESHNRVLPRTQTEQYGSHLGRGHHAECSRARGQCLQDASNVNSWQVFSNTISHASLGMQFIMTTRDVPKAHMHLNLRLRLALFIERDMWAP